MNNHLSKEVAKLNALSSKEMNNVFWGFCEIGNLSAISFLCENSLIKNPPSTKSAARDDDFGKKLIKSYGLYLACKNGHLEVVKYLTSSKDLLKIRNDGKKDFVVGQCNVNCTAGESLYAAASGGHLEIVKYLLSGEELLENYKNSNPQKNITATVRKKIYANNYFAGGGLSFHAIEYAAINGHLDVIKYLLKFNELNEKDLYVTQFIKAFYAGCLGNKLNVVKWLINESKLNSDYRLNKGNLNLGILKAAESDTDSTEVLKYLIESDDVVNFIGRLHVTQDNDKITLAAINKEKIETIKYLLSENSFFKVNPVLSENDILLNAAANTGNVNVLKLLEPFYLDASQKDNYNIKNAINNSLGCALSKGKNEITKYLVNNWNADISHDDYVAVEKCLSHKKYKSLIYILSPENNIINFNSLTDYHKYTILDYVFFDYIHENEKAIDALPLIEFFYESEKIQSTTSIRFLKESLWSALYQGSFLGVNYLLERFPKIKKYIKKDNFIINLIYGMERLMDNYVGLKYEKNFLLFKELLNEYNVEISARAYKIIMKSLSSFEKSTNYSLTVNYKLSDLKTFINSYYTKIELEKCNLLSTKTNELNTRPQRRKL